MSSERRAGLGAAKARLDRLALVLRTCATTRSERSPNEAEAGLAARSTLSL